MIYKPDYNTWDMKKSLDDFSITSKNLMAEGQKSRAHVVGYLITRCKNAEKRVEELETDIQNLKSSHMTFMDKVVV